MRTADLRHTFLVVALVGLIACGDGTTDASRTTVRDSAGVVVVESPASLEARELDWRVAAEPDLTIGVAEGEEPYQLFGVAGATQLPDGGIAILNLGTPEVRFFDADGRHRHSSGRRGSGPGEFQMPQLLGPVGPAGELLLWDPMTNRFTLLGPDGAVIRMVTPEGMMARMPQGWDGTAAVLVLGAGAAARPGMAEGVLSNDHTYAVVRLDGGDGTEVDRVSARIYHAQVRGQPWFRAIPFDPQPSAAAGPGAFYLSDGATAAVRVHGSDGRLVRVLRVARDPEPVTSADLDRFVNVQVQAIRDPGQRSEWRTRYSRMPVPATRPAYQSLLVDDDGHVWAEHFRGDPAEAPTWTVFDPERGALGSIQTPAGVAVLHIGRHALLGRTRGELEIEHVVRYPLHLSGAAR
jgi:hypothetical protein